MEGAPRRMAGFLIISSCCQPSRILTGNNSGYGNSAIDIVRCWKGGRCVDRDETKMELPASRVAPLSPHPLRRLPSAPAFSLLSECIECILRRKCSMRIIVAAKKYRLRYACSRSVSTPWRISICWFYLSTCPFIVIHRISGRSTGCCEEFRRFVSIRFDRKSRGFINYPFCRSLFVFFFSFFSWMNTTRLLTIVRMKFQANDVVINQLQFHIAGVRLIIWNRCFSAKEEKEKRKREREGRGGRVISSWLYAVFVIARCSRLFTMAKWTNWENTGELTTNSRDIFVEQDFRGRARSRNCFSANSTWPPIMCTDTLAGDIDRLLGLWPSFGPSWHICAIDQPAGCF